MHYCQFKAGEIAIAVETPEPLDIKEPYSLFLCEDEKTDLTVRFSYIKEILSVEGSIIKNNDSLVVSDDGECINFYYHILGEDDYYALRRVGKNEKTVHDIYIPERFKGRIWTRLVFTLINFDDVAAEFGASVFHAAFIEYNGEAILFTAPCGTGKSTQASLWKKYKGAEIINGDKALIYEKDGRCFVSGLPFSGSSNICKNKILPVKAIVRLGQAKENIVNRLKGAKAYKAVFEGCYHSGWNAEYNRATSLVAEKFALGVPVFSLDCLPDESAVEALENSLSLL